MTFTLQHIKKVYIGLTIGLLYVLTPFPAYSAEVENIEEAEIPPGLEEAIELKKVSEFKVIPLVDITALGTYSTIAGGNDLGGVDVRGSIAPALRLDRKNYIIPLYYGSYDRERQIVVEEEGGRVYNELMDHNATLEYKYVMDERTTFKLDGLARFHYVKEKGYDWSDGLYDYEDLGVGSSFEYSLIKTRAKRSSIGIGGEFYHREYPNYKSLISLSDKTAPETDEKDYYGYRPMLRYNYLTNKVRCTFLYSPIYKDFDDKKVKDSDGVLTDELREDWFHYARINLSYLPEASPVAFGLRLTGIVVDSNQNYHDAKGTPSVYTDDVFTENYYSFKSLNTNPYLTYIYKLKGKKAPATFTLGYAYQIRDYDDRKAQRGDSTYTEDAQLDQSHTINLQVVYPINEHVSAVAIGSWTKAISNMRYETYYQYRYESTYLAGGMRIKY